MSDVLNYHHLRYFWAVVREGGITRASERLHVSQPAISAQLRELERSLGARLHTRSGRSLVLTDVGRLTFQYAEQIFGIGKELVEVVTGRSAPRPRALSIGIVDAVPKLIVYRLVEPALRLKPAVRVVCVEGKPDRLIADLATHQLDLVLSDAPAPASAKVKAYSHLLGESGVGFFGVASFRGLKRRFPASLSGVPLLMPTEAATLRRSIDRWFEARAVAPNIVGEFEDSALMKVFGQKGLGLFPAPLALARDIKAQYGADLVGRLDGLTERAYAITVERRLKHPAAVAISEGALALFR
ncbi:MAG: LysR family transcriptional regulator [Vicinamibacteria bacterium]|nr:LysR family transcriptional regulator [Vicinamibacteria bacterium]